tara:strand:- start:257 stop:1342 length:1086 start_codon:yes stop_codon:yes gene_type:complete
MSIKKKIISNEFKPFLYSFLGSLLIISFFFVIPSIVEFKKNNFITSIEIQNKSKKNFEKVLTLEKLKLLSESDESTDVGLNSDYLMEDIIPTESQKKEETIRWSKIEIEKIFKENGYNLSKVRRTKLVQPIYPDHLPEQMKGIQNVKKRKSLFIKIVLPLILYENNRIKTDRIKLFNILTKSVNSKSEKKWLEKKFKQYGVVNKDLLTLKIRMDIIPVSLAIAQAAKETGWGSSRFALEGNALFGQWTWSEAGIKPASADSSSTHKVMRFNELKLSVRAYQRNLNTHSSYKDFRTVRAVLRDNKKKLNSLMLADYLDKYAETGDEYIKILKKIIKQNNLQDFDDSNLMPSSLQLKSLIELS